MYDLEDYDEDTKRYDKWVKLTSEKSFAKVYKTAHLKCQKSYRTAYLYLMDVIDEIRNAENTKKESVPEPVTEKNE